MSSKAARSSCWTIKWDIVSGDYLSRVSFFDTWAVVQCRWWDGKCWQQAEKVGEVQMDKFNMWNCSIVRKISVPHFTMYSAWIFHQDILYINCIFSDWCMIMFHISQFVNYVLIFTKLDINWPLLLHFTFCRAQIDSQFELASACLEFAMWCMKHASHISDKSE